MKYILSLALVIFSTFIFSNTAQAQNFEVDYGQSKIGFSGTHAGNEFEGVFNEWNAAIFFDRETPKESEITASFKAASAQTGNKMYDGTLPEADWFDAKNHEAILFESTKIARKEGNTYSATGDLTIRGITKPISFDFTLTDLDNDQVKVNANFVIDRLAYDIGKKSDAKAEWVSQNIDMTLELIATPKAQ
ncbi:MAG: YceI family protein [Pseudomonadota bacterium]